MRFQNKLVSSLLFAVVILFLSLFANIIPCKTSPNVPNPDYIWKFCTLNPDTISSLGTNHLYFGYSESIRDTYIFIALSAFLIALVVLALIARGRKD